MDTDGNVCIRGIVEAEDFIIDGKSVLTEEDKIDFRYLDLGKIVLNGETGDISLTGNIDLSGASSITWGKNKPSSVTYNSILSALKAANGVETTFITADAAGAPNIYAGNFYGGKFMAGSGSTDDYSVMDEDGFHIHATREGSFDIHGRFGGTTEYHFLKIGYFAGDTPYVNFSSPGGAYANWYFPSTNFREKVNFYGDVTFHGTTNIKLVYG